MKKVLVTGATGFVGKELCTALEFADYQVIKAGRDFHGNEDDLYAVIHLAGEPIASRWTEAKKARIAESRIQGTAQLVQKLIPNPPKIFISASGVGFYGERGDELVHEDSEPGNGFLTQVCMGWEEEARKLEEYGVRTVQTRFGMVLGHGGALAKMMLPYQLGLGGKIGSGNQWVSWIAIDDLVRAILFVLEHDIHGPVNFVSPEHVQQKEFAKELGEILHRPTWLSMPSFLVNLVFGQMGRDVLLASTKVEPQVLLENGFQFQHRHLKDALRHYCQK